jgi:HK97 family phage major capsid protein
MDNTQLLQEFRGLLDGMKASHDQAIEQIKKQGVPDPELREKFAKMENDMTALCETVNAVKERVSQAPQQAAAPVLRTAGERFVNSDAFKNGNKSGKKWSIRVAMESLFGDMYRGAVITTQDNPAVVREQRLGGLQMEPNTPLTVRDIIPQTTTTSNAIEYLKELAFTNNAGAQYDVSVSSPWEGVKKNESTLTFTDATANVRLIAHFMKASRQFLDDFPALQGLINNRLLYGLKLKEEQDLLNGDGTAGKILGLIPQATAYDATLDVGGDTKIDKLMHVAYQVMKNKYMTSRFVIGAKDWHDIQLIKDGVNGSYLMGGPGSMAAPRVWGIPVLPSLNMTDGDFLAGDFQVAAEIFDRQQATVEVATENEDDFVKNLITVLAEERLALAVYHPLALVEGSF